MQSVLNFSQNEKKEIRKILEKYEKQETKTSFEELRVKTKDATATLYSSGKLVIQGKNSEEVKENILREMNITEETLVGIDETGRGEKNGSFVISAVLGERNKLRFCRDSKKTTDIEEKATEIRKKALATVSFSVSAELIDTLRRKGITMNKIQATAFDCEADFFNALIPEARIIADGKKIETKNKKIEFLIKGDDKEPVIGAASIIAKSEREKSEKEIRKTWKNAGE